MLRRGVNDEVPEPSAIVCVVRDFYQDFQTLLCPGYCVLSEIALPEERR